MAIRPAGAPQGMVRAQMATFPPREGIFRKVVNAVLPQVDRLFIVFNGYDAVPADIAADPRIEAVVPDRDLRDVGKFWFPPGPDDIVFLIDDDLGYPPDYVALSIERAHQIGWDEHVFGYLGFNYRGEDPTGRERRWKPIKFIARLGHPTGVRMLGTGTVVARGDAVPPVDSMAPFSGHADIGFALHSLRAGRKLWALPRAAQWLTNDLPEDLRESSLYVSQSRNLPPSARDALREISSATMVHADRRYNQHVRDMAVGQASPSDGPADLSQDHPHEGGQSLAPSGRATCLRRINIAGTAASRTGGPAR